jgi:hypothetical protein
MKDTRRRLHFRGAKRSRALVQLASERTRSSLPTLAEVMADPEKAAAFRERLAAIEAPLAGAWAEHPLPAGS